MKQILQNMGSGETLIIECPAPFCDDGSVLINSTVSLISVGTEKMLVDFGRASYLEKAKQQPEKVKMVIDKVKTDGFLTTFEAVQSKLAKPIPLGYCNVGIVQDVKNNIDGLRVGDRVVSNGPHADVVRVNKNLCVKIPDNVTDEEAAFTVIASIGLQGIRLISPTLGETIVVVGVGLIGLLTVQLLRAHGCRVLAVDFDEQKLTLAKKFGAETCHLSKGQDPVTAGMEFSRERGVDGVIITASTKSSDPVSQAARMCRKRGRIVLVGVTGLELNRAEFYEKELTFQVSCSYGPGRYDTAYEDKGLDYPIGFVRWTEKRNFEAVLDMMRDGRIDVKSLITHRFSFEESLKAYEALSRDKSCLGVILKYSSPIEKRQIHTVTLEEFRINNKAEPILGMIGAGNYASRVLLPAFKKCHAHFHTISTSTGVSGTVEAKKIGFSYSATDTDALISNSDINTIIVATQHSSHAHFVCKALEQGKNVFVEKPLAITYEQLERVKQSYKKAYELGQAPSLMIGFNRRFSPLVKKMKELLDSEKGPKSFIMTMNAGAIPKSHWTQDPEKGGGRIIGEACHYIDLMRFFANSPIESITGTALKRNGDLVEDVATLSIKFVDGSHGSIHYFANGSSSFPKERVEAFVNGKILALDNFRKLKGYGWKNFSKLNLWKQDKGQVQCVSEFLASIKEGTPTPIHFDELYEVSKATIDVSEMLREQ